MAKGLLQYGGKEAEMEGARLTAPPAALPQEPLAFPLTDPSVLLVSVPRIVSQLCPALVAKHRRARRNGLAYFPNQGSPGQ